MNINKTINISIGFTYDPIINKNEHFYKNEIRTGFIDIKFYDLKESINLKDVNEVFIKLKRKSGKMNTVGSNDADSSLQIIDIEEGHVKYELSQEDVSEVGIVTVQFELVDLDGCRISTDFLEYEVLEPLTGN